MRMRIAKYGSQLFLASIMLIAVLSLSCKSEVEDEMLSVEETLGLAYRGSLDLRHVYSNANPDALPQLREFLMNRPRSSFHFNITVILGYIGNVDDVNIMKDILDQHEGTWGPDIEHISKGIFEAWAIMSRRGIIEADDAIREWFTFEKWDDELGEWPARIKYEYAWPVIRIYGRYSDADWRPLRGELLEGVEDEEVYKRISSYLSEDAMNSAINRRKEEEEGRITDAQREILRRSYQDFLSSKEKLFID